MIMKIVSNTELQRVFAIEKDKTLSLIYAIIVVCIRLFI